MLSDTLVNLENVDPVYFEYKFIRVKYSIHVASTSHRKTTKEPRFSSIQNKLQLHNMGIKKQKEVPNDMVILFKIYVNIYNEFQT